VWIGPRGGGVIFLRWTLWAKWNRATVEEANEIYAEVQAVINNVNNLILEQKAEQALDSQMTVQHRRNSSTLYST